MQIKKFGKLDEKISDDNIIRKTRNEYNKILILIKEYLLFEKIIFYKDTFVKDVSFYSGATDNDDIVEFEMMDRYGDKETISIDGERFRDLLKYIENPELYKNTHRYNL